MSFGFKLVDHKECPYAAEGPCATVYSFRKEEEDKSELQKFWEKPAVQKAPDHNALWDRLYDTEEGLLYSDWWEPNFPLRPSPSRGSNPNTWAWLRDESDDVRDPDHPNYHADALWAPIPVKDRKDLPKPYPSLRLFLFQVPDEDLIPPYSSIFVVGNGDVKDVDRPHEKPELKSALGDLRYVLNRVYERIEWEQNLRIVEDGYLLSGDKCFEPK